jgi:hypothetical protein
VLIKAPAAENELTGGGLSGFCGSRKLRDTNLVAAGSNAAAISLKAPATG